MPDRTFAEHLRDHLETWGPNCGAPRAVYEGHLLALLEAHKTEGVERLEKELADSIAEAAQYKALLHWIYVSWRREGHWCIPGDVQEQILQMFHKVPRGENA